MKPEQAEVIINELGSNYGNKLLNYAKETKFKKERGRGNYKDAQLFRHVLKGHVQNLRVEKFILKAYKHYKAENKKHAEELDALVA